MNTCIKCGCEDAYPSLPPCPTPEGCPNPQPCAEFFDAECVRFTLPDIECGTDTVVFQDDTLAEALDNIITYFCQKLVTLTNNIDAQLLVINNRLTAIEGDITTIQGDITNIQGDITTINTQIGEAMPVGSVIPWAGQSSLPIPDGWLLCSGIPVSITTYAALFAVIGDEYGTGAPVGTFFLPDLIDAIPYGGNSMNVGALVGNNTQAGNVSVDISAANLPEHTHGIGSLSINSVPDHTHGIVANDGSPSGGGNNSCVHTNANGTSFAFAMDPAGGHTHTFSGSIANAGTFGTTQATGTITSGDNRQRSISMRYMIKY